MLILQANEYENKEKKALFGPNFKSYFTLLIYPIITGATAIIVKDMEKVDIVVCSVIVVGALVILFVIVALIYPEISRYSNMYQEISAELRYDLEYLIITIEEKEEHEQKMPLCNR